MPLLLTGAGGLAGGGASPPANTLLTSLLCYYKCEEGAVDWDNSEGTAALDMDTERGNGVTAVAGKNGNAAYFDGASQMENTSTGEYYDDFALFTVSAWINTDTVAAGYRVIFCLMDSSSHGVWSFALSGDELVFVTSTSDEHDMSNRKETDAANLTTNTWYHVAATYDGSQATSSDRVELFVDGVKMASTETGTLIATNFADSGSTAEAEMGAQWSASEFYWEGEIDEVGIWGGRVLTDQEIEDMYTWEFFFDDFD